MKMLLFSDKLHKFKTLYSHPMKILFLLFSFICIFSLFGCLSFIRPSFDSIWVTTSKHFSSQTSLKHIVFGIASNNKSWSKRKEYVKLWWKPKQMKGCVFLERMPSLQNESKTLPPICISNDTSHFRYTYRGGYRSAIRVARVVLETVNLNHSDVRWFVFGDDDTLFITENLVKTLSKYDHSQWYYIGSNSESYAQNRFFSFEMAFGGGGFAISYPLARVLAKVLDSCLVRYPHVYGSDSRISSCLAELGVGVTHEPGFHQVDVRGDLFGLLMTHGLSPLVSLHHLDYIKPIFPNKTTNEALQHLFKAIAFDPQRILQQTICYDRRFLWTISISWGYAVQIFEKNILVPDILNVQKTFKPWNKGQEQYMFKTREVYKHPCTRPTTFFLDSLSSSSSSSSTSNEDWGIIKSIYRRNDSKDDCFLWMGSSGRLKEVRVVSHKLDLGIKQLQAPRRHCCDVLPSSSDIDELDLAIRECREDELTFMH